MRWYIILGGVLGAAGVLTIGLLLGHFAIPKPSAPEPNWLQDLSQDIDESLLQQIAAEIDAQQIEDHLRKLTLVPHMATTKGDEDLVKLIMNRWQDKDTGLDEAKDEWYHAFLSFPNASQPNSVAVVLPNGSMPFISQRTESGDTEDQRDPDVVQPYAAFSPPGNPKGKLVYANQGKTSDYEELLKQGVDLAGTIAIVRYGGAGRSAKAINGAIFGVIGVIVYTDPKDINDGKALENETYPHSWYLPPSGVERGSYNGYFGDLLTPYYPAKEHTYRINESEIQGIPPIPTQPIGFADARMLICELSGPKAPETWQGSLGCDYPLGPGFREAGRFSNTSEVQVNVYNYREIRRSANVMGVIRGSVEPDRYVLYGNHRDSWVHGAIDPSSGTAVMLEVTRVLGKKLKEGKWRPRRSIVFGSWGAEEFGLIGSTEYTEEYFSKLRERAVAYINVDISVFANATFRAQGTPPVQNVIFKAAQQVKIPNNTMVTVYDNWKRFFNRTSPSYGLIPSLGTLGAGSDYAPFIHYLGITSMDLAYTYDRSKTSARIYPAYHTAYDTFDYAKRYIDPGFTSHQTVARTAVNILLRLSDSLILPLNVGDYGETLDTFYNFTVTQYSAALAACSLDLKPLGDAIARFKSAATHLNQQTAAVQQDSQRSPLKVRMINDQLMLLERAFLNPLAFPDKFYYSHVLWASKTSGDNTFPGLADAYAKARGSQCEAHAWKEVHKHLTIAIQAVENAASTLEAVI
ncbi:aminopeptidase NAALADL1 [Ambystoma mexicanum]|uniref:aminopeptidase NAALADL1 n=1 Tax=Ambystoma mexicanum TaxID=8296 RepID=UPI0037E7CD09